MRRYPAISVAPAHLPNEVGQRSVAEPRCCSIGRRLKSIMSADRDKARPSPESGIRRAHEAEKARRLDVAAGVDRVRRYFQHASRDRHTRRMDHHRNGPSFDLLTDDRSDEHTSELQSLMRISYAVYCLKK